MSDKIILKKAYHEARLLLDSYHNILDWKEYEPTAFPEVPKDLVLDTINMLEKNITYLEEELK